MTRYFLLALTAMALLFGSTSLPAQKLDLSKLKGLKIRNIGPAGMSGRVTSIDAVHSNPNTIYIGTASGGLWKSESGGIHWKPVFDKQSVQSIGAVAIDQSNPSVVWAGTGEGNPRNSHNSGNGIYRSLDGGHSWVCMGLEATKTIHRIIVDPRNSDVVYVAALGSAWGPGEERGVFKTTDGGEHWNKVLYINDSTGCADLIIDPSNPNKLIAAMWQYQRQPWFFNSGGKGSGMYVTFDGGQSWKRRDKKNGLPEGPYGRMGLGVCHSKPNVVYALIETKEIAVYRSDDGGFNWRKRGSKNAGNRPFYYADIYVDPENENRVYSLWSFVSKSEDGGKTFANILPWGSGVHPDHHAFYIHPTDPNFLMDGNDGGLNISHDRGANWRFIENLPLGQFYHVNYDMDIPYNVYGGLQDNGSWVGPSEVWASTGGIRNFHWRELYFGDGFDVVPVPGNSRYVYAMSQGGNLSFIDRETGESQYVQPVHPQGDPLRFNWNAAIAQSPYDSCTVFFGSQYVHRSTDCGASWDIISPDLTTNDTAKQKQAQSGGLTIDATKAENYTTIITIEESPLQQNLIWAGTDDGRLHLTTDGGQKWQDMEGKLPGMPKGAWIPQIVASKHTANEAFVVVNDYRRDNWEPYLYHTRDFGKSWRRLADSKQVDGYCLSVVQDPEVENLLFLGTDHGLYVSIDYGVNWTKWDKGYPSVPTRDLKIHPREGDLIIGTFGRAIWILDDLTPLRAMAKQGMDLLKKPFHLFPIQDAYNGEIRSTDEGRFMGQGDFKGRNIGRGAFFYTWVAEPDEKEKLKIVVYDEEGDTVRNYTQAADTGLVKMGWGFHRNGIHFPSYHRPKKGSDLPSGPRVAPGKYSIQVSYKGDSSRYEFRVLPDPRLSYSATDNAFRESKIKEMYKLTGAATKAFNQLLDARKAISQVDGMMVLAADSLRDSVKTLGSQLSDSISSMMEMYMTPEGFEGYDHVTVRLTDLIWVTASYYISTYGRPGQNALNALANYRRELDIVLKRVNRFFAEDWKKYREFVESIDKPVFKDIDPVRVDR